MGGRLRVLGAGAVVLVCSIAGYLFLSAAPASASAPNSTLSYYVDTLNTTTWYNIGLVQGTLDLNRAGTQNRIVVFDFGSPALVNGVYGTNNLAGLGFHSRNDLAPIPEAFAWGYYNGVSGDHASQLLMAVGSSNYGSQVVTNGYQQGRAWSNFVQQVRTGIASFASQVSVDGAYDVEVEFNDPLSSANQANGFGSINSNYYYNYGDAGGCPQTGSGSCSNGWNVNAVWYTAWKATAALALPEIYSSSGSNAGQWANISLYSYNQADGAIQFSGTLAQHQACADTSNPCTGVNNTADTAWSQLDFALAGNSVTAMAPRWSDDISWP